MKKRKAIGRLAMRVEGEMWNAYYALENTMDGAVPLASMRITVAQDNPDLKDSFFELCKSIVARYLEKISDGPVTWKDLRTAPESEREP